MSTDKDRVYLEHILECLTVIALEDDLFLVKVEAVASGY
jgi:hypothetical protein